MIYYRGKHHGYFHAKDAESYAKAASWRIDDYHRFSDVDMLDDALTNARNAISELKKLERWCLEKLGEAK